MNFSSFPPRTLRFCPSFQLFPVLIPNNCLVTQSRYVLQGLGVRCCNNIALNPKSFFSKIVPKYRERVPLNCSTYFRQVVTSLIIQRNSLNSSESFCTRNPQIPCFSLAPLNSFHSFELIVIRQKIAYQSNPISYSTSFRSEYNTATSSLITRPNTFLTRNAKCSCVC